MWASGANLALSCESIKRSALGGGAWWNRFRELVVYMHLPASHSRVPWCLRRLTHLDYWLFPLSIPLHSRSLESIEGNVKRTIEPFLAAEEIRCQQILVLCCVCGCASPEKARKQANQLDRRFSETPHSFDFAGKLSERFATRQPGRNLHPFVIRRLKRTNSMRINKCR